MKCDVIAEGIIEAAKSLYIYIYIYINPSQSTQCDRQSYMLQNETLKTKIKVLFESN